MRHLNDINFHTEYLKAYEMIDHGKLEMFQFSSDYGTVHMHFIRRPVNEGSLLGEYSDIITPYGYGGPIICECLTNNEKLLISHFQDAFQLYCRREKIVCQFARFHPLIGNAQVFASCFDEVLPIRKVVAIDLTGNFMEEQLTSKARNEYRASIARGTTVRINNGKDAIQRFIEWYYALMQSKQARPYYFFPEEYFWNLFCVLPENVLLFEVMAGNTPLLYELALIYGDVGYCHLVSHTCERNNYFYANVAANVAAAAYAKSVGCRYYVLGGGVTSSDEDPLFRYKKKFSIDGIYPYYIGKKVYDRDLYQKLCDYTARRTHTPQNNGFFPEYRAI